MLVSCKTLLNIQNVFFNRVDDSKVKLKMAKTKYTLEEPKNVAERIKKGTDTKKIMIQIQTLILFIHLNFLSLKRAL